MTRKAVVILALRNKGLLIVFSGPSGSGKDTVLAELKTRDINMKQSISVTTRDMREGEVDGVDYFFTDVETFEKNIKEDYFLEYVKYGSNYYGTPKKRIEELTDEGSDVFLKIEVEGGGNVRKVFPECVSIFIVPPSMDELEKRLRGRGTETEESFNKRFAIAKDEIKRACEYDYIVVNDSVSLCADKVCAIIEAEKLKFSRMKALVDDMN
ncbi:MAG: guanylate kinase [Clostridia bacterium]|nr:guanylate kinase [Clostridia bacterium]